MENLPPEIIKKKLEKRSHMAKKFAMIPEGWQPPPHRPLSPGEENIGMPGYFRKHYIFFYGTLMNKDVLAKVLDVSPDDKKLKLRPAQIAGYHTRFWGSCPALLDGPQLDSHVDGMAYEALSQQEVDRLSAYETDRYILRNCMIKFLDIEDAENRMVIGETFLWNGSPQELTTQR
ncbi:hypothetical protein MaudMau93_006538 [Microsporum audouinii]